MGKERTSTGLDGLRGFGTDLPFVFSDALKTEERETIVFRNMFLYIMQVKEMHWARKAYAGMVQKEKMVHRFSGEYGSFVKPFPELLEGVLAQCTIPEVGVDLKENVDEERYGNGAREIIKDLHARGVVSYIPENTSHPELFKLIPKGFGFGTSHFDSDELPRKAKAYRDFLFDATHNRGFAVGMAVISFIEMKAPWESFADEFPDRTPHTPTQDMEEHPLAVYGLNADDLMLTLVHREFEGVGGSHTDAAFKALLDPRCIPPEERDNVLHFLGEALTHYNAWRDEEAELCGLIRDGEGHPVLA